MPFRIDGFIWLDAIVEKLIAKHHVFPDEVEECFFNSPYKTIRVAQGRYYLYGRTGDGRYLFVVFIWVDRRVKIITARDMTDKERRYFARK